MTYIENALYDFVKNIVTSGFRTLRNPRYFPYALFLFIIVVFSSFTVFLAGDFSPISLTDDFKDLVLYVELSAALSFILVGLVIGRLGQQIQLPAIIGLTAGISFLFYSVLGDALVLATVISAALYIAWVVIATVSTYSLIRDMFKNEVVGTILFLGKPEDDGKVLFRLIGWVVVLVTIGLGITIFSQGDTNSQIALRSTGIIVIVFSLIAIIPLLNIQRKHDVFYTILTIFFMFGSLRVLLLAFRSITQTQGSTSFVDTLISLFLALYTIQYAAVRGIKIGKKVDAGLSVEEEAIEEENENPFLTLLYRLITDRGIIVVILGVVMGYHSMQIQTYMGRGNFFETIQATGDADIVLLGYEIYLLVALIVYAVNYVVFQVSPGYRSYANPEVTRIPWAPPYDDLKLLVSSIKDGEISWKGDVSKLIVGMATDKLRGRLGRKSTEGRMEKTINRLIRRAKEEKEE